MTEAEYADIAAACDRLLRAPGTSLARLAIPALHFLNEHPSTLAQYASVLTRASERRFSTVPKAAIRALRQLTRALAAPQPAPLPRGPFDVVIVSHLLNPEQLRQGDDFYFGNLQRQLETLGISSLLLLINHLKTGASLREPEPAPFSRAILPATVPPATEVNIWRQCTSAWRVLRREAARANHYPERSLAMLASRQALSASTTTNLRMHAAIAAICQAVGPRMVVTTYEGTVAERLIWHAARSAKRRPLCVGYQHAMVLERAHAIRRAVAAPGLDCDPDVVLTLGNISHQALAARPELHSVRFIEYGSHRRTALPPLPPPHDRVRRCLVLPDAGHDECAILFGFALDCARRDPNISFALRPHPMVDTQSLLRRLPFLRNLPANAFLSVDRPLEQDLAQARYCLYRGSSAALHAARAGIKPYYLARSGELPFDCLFALTGWREAVTSPEDLLNSIAAADQDTHPTAAARAANTCEQYVSPLRPAAIIELLAIATP